MSPYGEHLDADNLRSLEDNTMTFGSVSADLDGWELVKILRRQRPRALDGEWKRCQSQLNLRV